MPDESKNPIDVLAAIKDMKKTRGWQVFMDRYAVEGNKIMDDLLDIHLSDNGVKYTKRDLLVYQLDALGKIATVLNEFEIEAKNEMDRQKHPPQKGI